MHPFMPACIQKVSGARFRWLECLCIRLQDQTTKMMYNLQGKLFRVSECENRPQYISSSFKFEKHPERSLRYATSLSMQLFWRFFSSKQFGMPAYLWNMMTIGLATSLCLWWVSMTNPAIVRTFEPIPDDWILKFCLQELSCFGCLWYKLCIKYCQSHNEAMRTSRVGGLPSYTFIEQ